MNIVLWFAQIILAILFGMAGLIKTTQPLDKVVRTITWAKRFPWPTVRMIGIFEILGSLGLILPWLLYIAPELTPYAACGLAVMQLLAILHHTTQKEPKAILFNLALLAMSVFVAYGRFGML